MKTDLFQSCGHCWVLPNTLLEWFYTFLNYGKIYPKPFLSVQFSGIKHIHNIIQPSPLSTWRTYVTSQIKTLYPLNNNFHSLFPQPQVTSILLSVSMNFPILDTSYKWNICPFVSDLLYLVCF